MSLKTWMDEFYPVDAQDVPPNDLALIEHSLTKWKGLRPENLQRHELKLDRRRSLNNKDADFADTSRPCFRVDSTTCALCAKYDSTSECAPCPFVQVTGDTCRGQFKLWATCADPEPMVETLETLYQIELGKLKTQAAGQAPEQAPEQE